MPTSIEELGFTKEKIGNGLLYSNFVYETDDKKIEELKSSFPDNCELFLYSDHLDDTKESEYRCAVIINPENKTVIFANAGTRPGFNMKGFYDLFDDVRLASGHLPKKLKPASLLNDVVIYNIQTLGEDLKEWKFDYSGHSLGAVMSNIAAADMAIKLKNKQSLKEGSISSIGFDNPGAKNLVQKMYKDADLNPEQAQKDVSYINMNNSKNFINTTNHQIGRTYELIKEGDKEPNSFSKFIGYLSDRLSFLIPPIIKKICNIISYGHLHKQVSGHSLTNFVDVIQKQKGKIKTPEGVTVSIDSAINKDYLIPYDKNLASYIKNRRKIAKAPKEMDFLMHNVDGKEFLISESEIIDANKNKILIPDSILRKVKSGGVASR